ncbi:unnamed protein product [Effrenium voratum]|nr:unnamed protein product [Effrenium voratum]
MPRQSSRPSAKAPRRQAPAPKPKPAPATRPAPQAPSLPAQSGGMSGLMGSMMSGMATGTGFSLGNRAAEAVFGPRQAEVTHRYEDRPSEKSENADSSQNQSRQKRCQLQQDLLDQCMQSSSDASACQSYLDDLRACQQAQ